ncbi:hypothetical protein Vadar_034028 [Vaccinium darrowii]|uniref:Uncharacterized protein n=1 Tax=Vaccinium darrowii TaxID=229202 RepID=A0ACB7XEB6_9ERIC|nr:hypothetical protein Vadar_034028 [Vaccinium darrowii]
MNDIASYEIANSDLLAGMDQTIADGVDIMSLSLDSPQTPYFEDTISIASLSAIEKGVVVICATGNDKYQNTIYNGAPWITTIGAGTADRSLVATLRLENSLTMEGTSYFPESVYLTDAPLYYGGGNLSEATCLALDAEAVAGKAAVPPHKVSLDTSIYELATDYALDFGTSMATTHVAGVAALLKAIHQDWSHINPNKAMDRGLIYDLGIQDDIEFLCGLGYNKKQMSSVLRRKKNFNRVVTSVGYNEAIYLAVLVVPNGMTIKVEPNTLIFKNKYQKQSFVVNVQIEKDAPNINYGYLKWIDQDNHIVSSPIVVLSG